MTHAWNNIELELIVADYFNMLALELQGSHYSKTDHRRSLMSLLRNRSKGSIEFKHQNISAVLINLGLPFIKGYLPRFNYQAALKDKIINHLTIHQNIESKFNEFASRSIDKDKDKINFEKLISEPPKPNFTQEPKTSYGKSSPIKTNYLEKEQKNISLGESGERIIVEYEKWSLSKFGSKKLANQVVWVSKEEGDGAGYDILSRHLDGSKKYIEVKTTKLTKETPIFFSQNELDFSIENKSYFSLYRLFDFEKNTKMFQKRGRLDSICKAHPINYKGLF